MPAFLAEPTEHGALRLVDANSAWLDLMGLPAVSPGGELPAALHQAPGVSAFLQKLLMHLRERNITDRLEGFRFSSDGRRYLVSLLPVLGAEDALARIAGVFRDATPPPSAETGAICLNRELRALSDCHQVMMRAQDEQTLLDDICRTLCEVAGYRMAWVGFPEHDGRQLIKPVAFAGDEGGYLSSVRISWAEESEWGLGPSGRAVRSGVPGIIQDFATDPGATPWREAALSLGYRSSIALPLKDSQDRTFGVLNLYAGQSHAFSAEERMLLEKLSSDLAFQITVLRARLEKHLAEEERLANLHFFQCMDRVNRAIQGATDLEQMMTDVLDAVMEVFQADRAYLLYPCDPGSPVWQVPMERFQPKYPGILAQGIEMEMTPEVAETFRILLESEEPVQFGPGTPYALPADVAERFQLKSFMSMALYPKLGMPWQFGIHQCAATRLWNPNEVRIMKEIGQRLSQGLTGMLSFRAHLESEARFREAERHFHTLVDNLPDCIARFGREGRVSYVNRSLERTLGISVKEIIGTKLLDTGPGGETENALLSEMVKRTFDEGEATYLEMKWNSVGGIRHFEVMNIPERDDEGRVASVLGVAHDVTGRKLTEEALRNSEERYRRIVDTASEGIWVVDSDNLTSFVNARMADMMGYQTQEMLGQPMDRYLFEEDRETLPVWRAATHGGKGTSEEQRLCRHDGDVLWTLASASPIFGAKGEFQGSITLFTDITERKRQQEQLLYQAHFDPLTDLPNRFLAMDRLEQNIRQAARSRTSTALLFLDLDDFKKVNDALGHEVGDRVLKLASARLKQAVRASDTVARLGGDEFIILIHDIPDGEAVRSVAEKIVQAFQEVFRVMGREVMLTASLGISIFPDDGNEPLVLLRNADTAMYHAKAMGRNAYQYFTESMNLDVARRLQMEEQLRQALGQKEFYLEYQPIVEVSSRTIVGVEALLRWRNRVLDEVSPAEFIDVAEQTGLIIAIGEWVIETALGDLRAWGAYGGDGIRLAINVSPRQFRQAGFIANLEHELQRNGIRGEQLELEITEGILLGGEVGAAGVITRIRELGVYISMDDFGTGYSSLSYLRHYRFDTLKIDRVFIRDVIDDPNDRELIVATLRMARGLGVRVVAEGVETNAQFEFLQREMCDCAQGFYLSRPVSAERIVAMLKGEELLGIADGSLKRPH